MSSPYLSISQVASLIDACTKILRSWDEKGGFKADFRTMGHHRRYERTKIVEFTGKQPRDSSTPREMRCVIYGIVSSLHQKHLGDLTRQLEGLKRMAKEKGYHLQCVYSDVGSNLNEISS